MMSRSQFFFWGCGDAVGYSNALAAPRIMMTDWFKNNGIERVSNF